MVMRYPDYMVDLETTGTRPDRTGIIQLACVKFNLETGEVCPNVFDRALIVPPHRFWDESTREWWLKDKRAILEGIMARMEKPEVVIQAFRDFVMADTDPYNDNPRLWGKPSHFEYPFLESYFSDFGIGNPFHFRQTNDMNSFLRGRYWPHDPPAFEKLLPMEGDAHNAIHDVLHQVKVLLTMRGHTVKHIDWNAPGYQPG